MKWYIFWNIFLGDLCAAKFLDGQWYRGKVLKTSATEATILYIDYGNRGINVNLNFAWKMYFRMAFFLKKKKLFFDGKKNMYYLIFLFFRNHSQSKMCSSPIVVHWSSRLRQRIWVGLFSIASRCKYSANQFQGEKDLFVPMISR